MILLSLFWTVQFTPRIVDTVDLVSDQFATEDAMSKTITAITDDDVDMFVALVQPDNGNVIHRLENPTRPFVVKLRALAINFSARRCMHTDPDFVNRSRTHCSNSA